MTSFNLLSEEAPSLKATTQGVRASTYESVGDTNIQSIHSPSQCLVTPKAQRGEGAPVVTDKVELELGLRVHCGVAQRKGCV